MSILSRLRARRFLDAVTAERLLAGRGVPGDAPAGQQVLARALEVISGPGSEEELADEVAAAAVFVQVTSNVRSRHRARRVLVAAVCVLAVGGTAVYGVLSPGNHKAAPMPLRVPSPRLAVSPSRIPHVVGPGVNPKGHSARRELPSHWPKFPGLHGR